MSARLIPLWAGARALEAVGSFAYDTWRTGPTMAEQRAMDDDERRDGRCIDLAAEAFDDCSDDVCEWLAEDEQREEVTTYALAKFSGDDDGAAMTLDRLRERYVDKRAGRYLRQVEDEERRDAEDAAADAWIARREAW